jgi:hypothetical protein
MTTQTLSQQAEILINLHRELAALDRSDRYFDSKRNGRVRAAKNALLKIGCDKAEAHAMAWDVARSIPKAR